MNATHEQVQVPARVWLSGFQSPVVLDVYCEYVDAEPDVGHLTAGYNVHMVYMKLTPQLLILLGHAIAVEGSIDVAIKRDFATVGLDMNELAIHGGRLLLDSSKLESEIEEWLLAATAGERC